MNPSTLSPREREQRFREIYDAAYVDLLRFVSRRAPGSSAWHARPFRTPGAVTTGTRPSQSASPKPVTVPPMPASTLTWSPTESTSPQPGRS